MTTDGAPPPDPRTGAVSRFLRGLKYRIAGSIAIFGGGIIFLILFLAFAGPHLTWYQNVAVVLATVIAVPVGLLLIWILWGLGIARRGYRAFWE